MIKKVRYPFLIYLFSLQLTAMGQGQPASAPTNVPGPRDNLAAKSRPEDALTRQLYGATLCTTSFEEVRLFYEQGFGMTLTGPLPESSAQKADARRLYQGMSQISPVDANGLGGPGYSAQIVASSDEMIRFYATTLGLEVRSDRTWTTSGALGVPPGTHYRFLTLYAKGASFGHILFIEYKNQRPIDPAQGPGGVAPRLPNRGLGLWTFGCRDLAGVYASVKQAGYTVLTPPGQVDSPYYGRRKVMTLLAPNGFIVELIQD